MPTELQLFDQLALPFLLSKPKAATQATAQCPVLCFLHGLDEGPPTSIYSGATAHGPLSPRSSPLASSDFMVAAPQLPARGDIWGSYAAAVCEIVSFVHASRGGDRSRTYLTGFSYGGNGVFDIALHAPSLWAALWPVDPTRVPVSDPGIPVWFSAGQASRGNNAAFIERLRLQSRHAGPGDRVFEDEGLDHVGTATSSYRNDIIYRWLLAKHSSPQVIKGVHSDS